jgi:hypothetical protein
MNGKKWQVMVMGNNCKFFSGSIPYERLAARIYDRFALQHFGLRAKVNLSYTRSQLLHVVKEIEMQISEQLDLSEKPTAAKSDFQSHLHPTDMIILRGSMPLSDLDCIQA